MNEKEHIIASVVIPCYGRSELLDRAIQSVIACDGSEQVEIIVVDDCSPEPIASEYLRDQDRIIRLTKNSGPAVGRNRGMENARGRMVYLLDSDDMYIDRNFVRDVENHAEEEAVFYCEIDSQGFSSDYPDKLEEDSYFSSIFFKNPHIGQSTSLCFPKKLGIRFDEKISKHDDWDFIFCQALKKGIEVRKIEGRIFFDRSDRTSISRRPDGEKSLPWVEKITKIQSGDRNFDATQFTFHILAQYPPQYSWVNYFFNGVGLLASGRTSFNRVAVKGAHRLIAIGNRLAGKV